VCTNFTVVIATPPIHFRGCALYSDPSLSDGQSLWRQQSTVPFNVRTNDRGSRRSRTCNLLLHKQLLIHMSYRPLLPSLRLSWLSLNLNLTSLTSNLSGLSQIAYPAKRFNCCRYICRWSREAKEWTVQDWLPAYPSNEVEESCVRRTVPVPPWTGAYVRDNVRNVLNHAGCRSVLATGARAESLADSSPSICTSTCSPIAFGSSIAALSCGGS
jgi:hypothetical protein